MKLKNILITLPLLFPLTSFADVSSCASFLTLANFNLSQSGNNADIDALKKATFCSSSYKSDPDQDSLIESAGYYLFNVNPAQIASTQKEICGDVFGSNAYLKDASIPVKNAYSAAFKSWDNCQELSKKEGVNFDMQLDPLMQSLTVTLSTNSTNNVVPFQGLMQSVGGGHSICKTTSSSRANSKLTKVIAVDDTTGFDFDANNKLTIICNRQMQKDSNGESADAQTLTFNTKVGTYQVPLAATGVLSKVSVDKVMADVQTVVDQNFKGAVLAFTSSPCPTGWTEYTEGQGKFILGASETHPFGQIGGEETHQLTIAEMPSHSHDVLEMIYNNDVDGVDSTTTHSYEHHDESRQTGLTGGNQPFAVMPPFKALTICKKL